MTKGRSDMRTIGYAVLAVFLLVGAFFLLYPGASGKRGAGHETAGGSAPPRAVKAPKVVEVNPPGTPGMGVRDLTRSPRELRADLLKKWPNLKERGGPTADQLKQSGLPADKAQALAGLMAGGKGQKQNWEPPPYPTVLDMTPAERRAAIRNGVTKALTASKTKLSPEAKEQVIQQLAESVDANMARFKELYLERELQGGGAR
jgi:hypothetical protein